MVFLVLFLVKTPVCFSQDDISRLLNNEVIVKPVKNENGLPGVQAAFLIAGSREEIWRMLNDYNNYKSIYGGIDSLKVLHKDNKGAILEFWSDVGNWRHLGVKVHFVLQRNYDSVFHKLTWKRFSGDLKEIQGGWEILESSVPAKKLLIYRTFLKYGGVIPTSLIRKGAMNAAESMALRLRDWLKNHPSIYK